MAVDAVFRALADPSRRHLLDSLNARNGQTLGELCGQLEMARQSVSKHLAVLEEANLVTTVWRGREKLHYLNAEPINAIAERWIDHYSRERVRALADLKRDSHMASHPIRTPEDHFAAVDATDLSPARIAAAASMIDPVFLHTPQFVNEQLSATLRREVVIKNETLTPIGSFKGRGAWLLAQRLDPARTWVCSTAGNFGQGLAYAARARGATVEAFVSADVPAAKIMGMRALGAHVRTSEQPGPASREHAAAAKDRLLVVDGLDPDMAEGAGTIGLELDTAGPIDLIVVQIGDGALISGVACWLKAAQPRTRIVGVCASGAPAMARSFAAGRVVRAPGTTIATALEICEPVPESLARIIALVDEIVLVDDDDLRRAQQLILQTLNVPVEPAGAAGVAALARHGARLRTGRAAVVLTGAGATRPHP